MICRQCRRQITELDLASAGYRKKDGTVSKMKICKRCNNLNHQYVKKLKEGKDTSLFKEAYLELYHSNYETEEEFASVVPKRIVEDVLGKCITVTKKISFDVPNQAPKMDELEYPALNALSKALKRDASPEGINSALQRFIDNHSNVPASFLKLTGEVLFALDGFEEVNFLGITLKRQQTEEWDSIMEKLTTITGLK